jgi:predicted Rossmann-fold nucleotide-binding protein
MITSTQGVASVIKGCGRGKMEVPLRGDVGDDEYGRVVGRDDPS